MSNRKRILKSSQKKFFVSLTWDLSVFRLSVMAGTAKVPSDRMSSEWVISSSSKAVVKTMKRWAPYRALESHKSKYLSRSGITHVVMSPGGGNLSIWGPSLALILRRFLLMYSTADVSLERSSEVFLLTKSTCFPTETPFPVFLIKSFNWKVSK